MALGIEIEIGEIRIEIEIETNLRAAIVGSTPSAAKVDAPD